MRDKRPATANGFKDATRDPEQIRAWWRQDENFNIGIATGTASGVFVIDVDDDGGEHELCKLGVLPDTVEAITARGRHIYFRMPKSPISNSASKIAPHVDCRGNGGYVLAPPSIHPSGKRYCWSVDSSSKCADAPAWLLAKLKPEQSYKPSGDHQWRALLDGIGEGCRDVSLTSLIGYLLSHGVDSVLARHLAHLVNNHDCDPPLSAADVDRIANSIAGREIRKHRNGR